MSYTAYLSQDKQTIFFDSSDYVDICIKIDLSVSVVPSMTIYRVMQIKSK